VRIVFGGNFDVGRRNILREARNVRYWPYAVNSHYDARITSSARAVV
jgi:hypothetical protein